MIAIILIGAIVILVLIASGVWLIIKARRKETVDSIPHWFTASATLGLCFVGLVYAVFTAYLWIESRASVKAMEEQIRLGVAPNSIPYLEVTPADIDDQLEELLIEIGELGGKISGLEGQIETSKDDLEKTTEEVEANELRSTISKLDSDLEDANQEKTILEGKVKTLKDQKGIDYTIRVLNAKDEISLNVKGFIFEYPYYLAGHKRISILKPGEPGVIKFLGDKNNRMSRGCFEDSIREDWGEVIAGDIFEQSVMKKFLNVSEGELALLIIYTDACGTVYITRREFNIEENGNVYAGPIEWDFIEKPGR